MMDDELQNILDELAEVELRRNSGLPPRSAEEAAQYFKLILLQGMLNGVSFHFVDLGPVNEVPDTVPAQWVEQYGSGE